MDDYGNDMLDIASTFTLDQDNAVCRWLATGMDGDLSESFLRSIEAIEPSRQSADDIDAALEEQRREFFDSYTPRVIEEDPDAPYAEYVVGGVVLTREEYLRELEC